MAQREGNWKQQAIAACEAEKRGHQDYPTGRDWDEAIGRCIAALDALPAATGLPVASVVEALEMLKVLPADPPDYFRNIALQDAIAAVKALQPVPAATTPAPTWQPMETAPKDGVPIRLFAPEFIDEDFCPHGSVEGYWQDEQGWIGACWDACQDVWEARVIRPTHWQPLPAPPAVAEPAALDALPAATTPDPHTAARLALEAVERADPRWQRDFAKVYERDILSAIAALQMVPIYQVAAPAVPAPADQPSSATTPCINCHTFGGHETNDGSVGQFCDACWSNLQNEFASSLAEVRQLLSAEMLRHEQTVEELSALRTRLPTPAVPAPADAKRKESNAEASLNPSAPPADAPRWTADTELLRAISTRLRRWCNADGDEAEVVVEMVCDIRNQIDAALLAAAPSGGARLTEKDKP